jgi:hypothetical protein
MNPAEVFSNDSARQRVLAPSLEPDVNCAAAIGVPVLISAEADVAEWLARVIHDRSERKSEAFVLYRPGTGDQLGLLKRLLNGSGPGRGTLFVADVAHANREVQAFLRDALAVPQPDPNARFRVIAATSTWIFDQVERGEFDDFLFYRLNKIHIRVGNPEKADRPEANTTGPSDPPNGITRMDVAAFRKTRLMLRAGYAPLQPHAASAVRHG